jgi:hypothetical protein
MFGNMSVSGNISNICSFHYEVLRVCTYCCGCIHARYFCQLLQTCAIMGKSFMFIRNANLRKRLYIRALVPSHCSVPLFSRLNLNVAIKLH